MEGHTDSVGGDAYNQRLSEQRGEAVRDYLTLEGMQAGSVTSRGFGKTQPVASNGTAEGRQQNRRVELVISGDVIGAEIGNPPSRSQVIGKWRDEGLEPLSASPCRHDRMVEETKENVCPKKIAVVAIYESHPQAEEALKELQRSGFDMKKLSIVGKAYHTEEQVVGYYNAGDRMKRCACPAPSGALSGASCSEIALFAIPGIGPVVVAGPLVAWIISALEGAVAVGGLSAIGAGLYSIGVPKNSIVQYESAIKSDKFLLLAHGTAEEVETAKGIMRTAQPVEVAVHGAEQHETAGAAAR